MSHKPIAAALVSMAFLLSSTAAVAADNRPAVVSQTASTTTVTEKAPVAGMRLKPALKNKSNALPALTIALIILGVAGGIAAAVAISGGGDSDPVSS